MCSTVGGKPYLVQLNAYQQGVSRYGAHPAKDEFTITSQETGDKALCGGDSGSPWYANVSGVEKIVAVTVGASGCKGPGSGKNGTLGTVIYPYLYLLENHWSEYLKDLPDLQKNNPGIDLSLPLIQRSGGCDAYVNAVLQISKDNVWTDFLKAQGWQKAVGCPATNPYQPWVRANIPTGTIIRWHIFATGQWDFYTDPISYVNPLDKLPKVDPAPTATASASPQKSAKPVSVSIICTKGKSSKTISGLNPKCPSGYKLKK